MCSKRPQVDSHNLRSWQPIRPCISTKLSTKILLTPAKIFPDETLPAFAALSAYNCIILMPRIYMRCLAQPSLIFFLPTAPYASDYTASWNPDIYTPFQISIPTHYSKTTAENKKWRLPAMWADHQYEPLLAFPHTPCTHDICPRKSFHVEPRLLCLLSPSFTPTISTRG